LKFSLYIPQRLAFITEETNVYCAVRPGPLNKMDYVAFRNVSYALPPRAANLFGLLKHEDEINTVLRNSDKCLLMDAASRPARLERSAGSE